MATSTAPSQWWDEDPATVLTAVAVLDETAKAQMKAMRRGR